MKNTQERADLAKLDANIASRKAELKAYRRLLAECQASGRDTSQVQEIIAAVSAELEEMHERGQK